MHAPFHIRPATKRDLGALVELGPRTFLDTFGEQLPTDFIAERMAVTYDSARVANDLADPDQAWFVAEGEGGLVGFLSLRGGPAPECVASPHPMELQRLYVAQEWHGRGPGAALMLAGEAEARARGAECLWLQAWEANPRALNFYRKHGYEGVGTQIVEFGGRQLPHVVMAKIL